MLGAARTVWHSGHTWPNRSGSYRTNRAAPATWRAGPGGCPGVAWWWWPAFWSQLPPPCTVIPDNILPTLTGMVTLQHLSTAPHNRLHQLVQTGIHQLLLLNCLHHVGARQHLHPRPDQFGGRGHHSHVLQEQVGHIPSSSLQVLPGQPWLPLAPDVVTTDVDDGEGGVGSHHLPRHLRRDPPHPTLLTVHRHGPHQVQECLHLMCLNACTRGTTSSSPTLPSVYV